MDKDDFLFFKKEKMQAAETLFDFDNKYGTLTTEGVWINDRQEILPKGFQNRDKYPGSCGFALTAFSQIDTIVKELENIKDIDNYSFIDIGNAKGRIPLYLFLENDKFLNYFGVELDINLYNQSLTNLKILQLQNNERISFYNINALDFMFPDNNCVIFLYHPFDLHIYKLFLEKTKNFIHDIVLVTIAYCEPIIPDYENFEKNFNFQNIYGQGLINIYIR